MDGDADGTQRLVFIAIDIGRRNQPLQISSPIDGA